MREHESNLMGTVYHCPKCYAEVRPKRPVVSVDVVNDLRGKHERLRGAAMDLLSRLDRSSISNGAGVAKRLREALDAEPRK